MIKSRRKQVVKLHRRDRILLSTFSRLSVKTVIWVTSASMNFYQMLPFCFVPFGGIASNFCVAFPFPTNALWGS